MIDRIQSESGLQKQENETVREYIHRVSDKSNIDSDLTQEVIEAWERRQFSRSHSEPVTTSQIEKFIQEVEIIEESESNKSDPLSARQNIQSNGQDGNGFEHSSLSTYSQKEQTESNSELAARLNTDRFEPIDIPDNIEQYISPWALRYLPVLLLFALITTPIPTGVAPAAEVATYFQALAFANGGVDSLFYIVLQESDASLHLYSLLSSPLVAVGYVEAPRLISVFLAAISAAVIGKVARQQWGRRAGLVAPVVLLSNLYFLRYSWAALSYSVAIALTVGAVATMYHYSETDEIQWLGISLLLVLLGVTNHAWEATIGLPLLAILVWQRRWKASALLTLTVVGSVALVTVLTGLQPNPANTTNYSVVETGISVLLTADWWEHWFTPLTWENLYPFIKLQRLHFVASIALFPIWIAHTIQFRQRESLVMAAWIASGLSIPFLLPGGVVHHYYLWATIAPVTLSVVYGIRYALRSVAKSEGKQFGKTVLIWTVVVLCLTSGMQIAAVELGHREPSYSDSYVETEPTDVRNGEAVAAGRTVRKMNVESPRQLVFVGDWQVNGFNVYRSGVVRVLIYGGFEMKGTWHDGAVPGATDQSPQLAGSVQEATSRSDCRAVVVRTEGGGVEVHSC